jgi:hypothetical protein
MKAQAQHLKHLGELDALEGSQRTDYQRTYSREIVAELRLQEAEAKRNAARSKAYQLSKGNKCDRFIG